ncbi:MAG: ATP-binding protein, partial [Bacteroidales bacterium]|nr:ATP-binding protein [Bacteroidales bacterium]
TSKKVTFVENIPDKVIEIPLNTYLFEWVIENVCKNAIDAMNGAGTFSIILGKDDKHVFIDLCDTGKGIPGSLHKKIFQPGFTTKQRGWGLGLSLAKRIIADYHKGKIFVKYSVLGQGTAIRIVLPKK